jgi:3-oxoadipate enol-lactonase
MKITNMKKQIGDIEVFYTIEGQGPWLTMSHSLACNTTAWDEQAALLSKDFTVLRYDTRGHGQTSATSGPYTLEQLADDAYGLLSVLGIQQTHWMGISMGGMIGQTMALKYPTIFTSLLLIDTTSRRPDNAQAMWNARIEIAKDQGMQGLLASTLERWFTEPFRLANPERIKPIADGILTTSVDGFSGCCAAIAEINTLDRLKEIQCPALVMVGEQDHGTPPAMARLIHENLPNSDFVLIENAAHIANIEQPEIFNQAIQKFLREL